MLLVYFVFIYEAYKGQALVNFFKVQHYVLVTRWMMQSNRAAALVVEREVASALVGSIDTRNINQNINQLTADFIILHLYGILICSNVNLGNDVEEEGFLDLRGAN